MKNRIFFGKVLAEIADQNSQGRFQNTAETGGSCMVYEEKRQPIFSCKAGDYFFRYSLNNGQHLFSRPSQSFGEEYLTAGWDGLTHGEQMAFISDLYDFMYSNRMTDASLGEFVEYLSKSPVRT